MEIKKIIILISFTTFIFSYPLNYKIKYFGVNIADCIISRVDTVYEDIKSVKITYKVKTKPFFKKLFPVNNSYEIILNDKNNILFFSKKTFQPKIENFIDTEIENGRVFYKNTKVEIPKQSYNIFSLLYSIMDGIIPEKFILEKEGAIYNGRIHLVSNNIYNLEIFGLEAKDNDQLIEYTDIFTWGIFMNKVKRRLIINKENDMINQCIFTKGLITIKAELTDY